AHRNLIRAWAPRRVLADGLESLDFRAYKVNTRLHGRVRGSAVRPISNGAGDHSRFQPRSSGFGVRMRTTAAEGSDSIQAPGAAAALRTRNTSTRPLPLTSISPRGSIANSPRSGPSRSSVARLIWISPARPWLSI